MPQFEYKVIPAPEKVSKVKGLKGAPLFAHALEKVMNELGAEGWHYLRTDILPQEERSGLTSKTVTYRNLLVFQREIAVAVEKSAEVADAPPPPPPAPESKPEPVPVSDPEPVEPAQESDLERSLFPHRQGQRVDL